MSYKKRSSCIIWKMVHLIENVMAKLQIAHYIFNNNLTLTNKRSQRAQVTFAYSHVYKCIDTAYLDSGIILLNHAFKF